MRLLIYFLLPILSYSQVKTWNLVQFNPHPNELYQIRMGEFIDGELQIQWATDVGDYRGFTIGDCDNDGENELIISKSDSILIINNNDFNDREVIPIPNQLDKIESIHVADVTGDGNNELIFARTYAEGQFFVYKFKSENYEKIYQNSCWVFHLSVGDVDNDGIDEILLPEDLKVRIFKYSSTTNNFENKYTISSDLTNDVTMVGDVTNNGTNEVVVGGSHSQARIFKLKNNIFTQIYNLPFSGFTQGIAIGDVNGDNKNELLVGEAGADDKVFVYNLYYSNSVLSSNLIWSDNISYCQIPGIYLGDFNGDDITDFCVDQGTRKAKFYSYDGVGSFDLDWNSLKPIRKTVASNYTISNKWRSYFSEEISIFTEQSGINKLKGSFINYGPTISNVSCIISRTNPYVKINDSLLTIDVLEYTDTLIFDNIFSFEIIDKISDPSLTFNISFYKDNIIIASTEITVRNPSGIFPDVTKTVQLNKDFSQQQNSPLFIDLDDDNNSDIFVTILYFGTDYNNNRLVYWGNSSHTYDKGGLAGNLNNMYLNFITDINNDSHLEIVETGRDRIFIWKHEDGDFTNIRSDAGFFYYSSTMGGNSLDYNNDGFLDIFIATGNTTSDMLFRNNGDDTFIDVSKSTGITSNSDGQTVVTGDFNNDGLVDIYIGCYGNPNLFYVAERKADSTIIYRERAEQYGVDFVGDYMGAGFADINNDGYLDLFVIGWDYRVPSYLMLNQNGKSFIDISSSSGFADYHGVDIAFIDYNHDKFIDVISGGNQYGYQENFTSILQNNGDNTFTNVAAGTVITDNSTPNLFSVSDYNNDGRADLLTTLPLTLYKNNIDTLNWLAIKIKGIENNSLAIGAKVKLVTNRFSQYREVNSNSGNDTQLFFGLGENQQADSIIVKWPKGNVTVFNNISANQSVVLTENGDILSAIKNDEIVNHEYKLMQNYPNPFNPETIITYSLPKLSQVTLKIYNALGEEIITLVDEEKSAGHYMVNFNATNLSSGIYFYRLQANEFIETKKLMLLK